MCTQSSRDLATTSLEICARFQLCGDRSNSNTPGCGRSWSVMRTSGTLPTPRYVQMSRSLRSKRAKRNSTHSCRHISRRRHSRMRDRLWRRSAGPGGPFCRTVRQRCWRQPSIASVWNPVLSKLFQWTRQKRTNRVLGFTRSRLKPSIFPRKRFFSYRQTHGMSPELRHLGTRFAGATGLRPSRMAQILLFDRRRNLSRRYLVLEALRIEAVNTDIARFRLRIHKESDRRVVRTRQGNIVREIVSHPIHFPASE